MTIPAKCSPDGFVAQRLMTHVEPPPKGPRGPWVLTFLNPIGDLAVRLLTDEEVADWPIYGPVCCDLHGRNCEPPSELCCPYCTESSHPDHRDGVQCSSPDLSAVKSPWVN